MQRTGVAVAERKLKPLPYTEVFESEQVLTEGGGEPLVTRHLSRRRQTVLENIPVTSHPRQQSATRETLLPGSGGDRTHGWGVAQLL